MAWDTLPSDQSIEKTITSLKANGMDAYVVTNQEEARQKVLDLIPEGSEVMTMTSVTTDTIGLSTVLNESGKYDAVKPKLYAMDAKLSKRDQKKLGAAPDYAIGSVHAITEDGRVVIASNTGSQLPGYAYGSDHVIWVVGAQKIVKDLDAAFTRIQEHTLPLESERARKAYGTDGSNISKMLIVNKEVTPDRIKVIFIKEVLGY